MRTSITVSDARESVVRTMIVNTYRQGYDDVVVSYKGAASHVKNTIDILDNSSFRIDDKGRFVLSFGDVSEFNPRLVEKMLFALEQCISELSIGDVPSFSQLIQHKDNILKRCISCRKITMKGSFSLWRFSSYLAQTGRSCLHAHAAFQNKSLGAIEAEFLRIASEMVSYLKKCWLKQTDDFVSHMHDLEQESIDLLESHPSLDASCAFHLKNVCRSLYLCGSPLIAYFQAVDSD